MKEIQQVMEKYNKSQEIYYIISAGISMVHPYKDEFIMRISKIGTIGDRLIGFYQWLFAPEFKVFEVFNITYIKTSMFYEIKGDREKVIIRQPEEIIKFLAGGAE